MIRSEGSARGARVYHLIMTQVEKILGYCLGTALYSFCVYARVCMYGRIFASNPAQGLVDRTSGGVHSLEEMCE